MIEQENKVLLSRFQYDIIDKKFKWNEVIEQKNYYYVNDFTINKDITVRVREKKSRLLLQVKIPISKKESLHIKKEYEKEILELPTLITSKELEDLCGCKLGDVKYLSELQTLRKVCNWSNNVEICLDLNKYLNITDYELEIEYVGLEPRELIEHLTNIDICFKRNIKGKFSRFMSEYIKLNNRMNQG
ncbi:CYTH domain-containing protein [Clostridium cibarium]|uniref:CYTH domain-containing protein n=1 Tax=Clostridium cibarium TaxID=2762247 RepID=A0ABR8PWK2_9CLOT|nr:CYTH domain-containing protein [Clostridium cibarium]MBD7912520.1 CYTH domain-containing protein [Clostridium cibarium]